MSRAHNGRSLGRCALLGIALTALPLGGATMTQSAAAEPAAGQTQTYFVATTSASAASVSSTQRPASSIITSELVDDSLGYTATAFDSQGGAEAQAASVYPGDLVVQGPSLLCGEGVLPFACPVTPPSYPLLADAKYPQSRRATATPKTSTVGAGTALVAHPASSIATAGATSAIASTSTGSATVLTGTPVALSIGSQSSHSSVVTSATSAVVTVVSSASDIDVAGILQIGSVTSRDVQRLTAGKPPVDRPTVTVTGVTVAGRKATVGPKGLQVAGHDGPKVLRQLSARGVRVEPVGVSRDDTKRGARSTTTGLIITTALPLKHAPYVPNPLSSVPPFDQVPGVDLNGTYLSTIQLGAAGAAAGIEQQSDPGLGKLGKLPVTPTPPAHHRSASGGAAQPPRDGGTPPSPGTAPRRGSAPVVAPVAAPVRLVADTTNLESFYLAMALGAAALFVGWRLRVVTRARGWVRNLRA
jgi:hypothetical protein